MVTLLWVLIGMVGIVIILQIINSRPSVVINQDQYEQDNSDELKKQYEAGINHMAITTQVAIYKLYVENSILDFDGYIQPLYTEINKFVKNPAEYQLWVDKFNTYWKERNA